MSYELLKQALDVLEPIAYEGEDALSRRASRLRDAIRAHFAQPQAEPDMRHPKIQALIGGRARANIALQLVEQLIEDPNFETTALDMEHWDTLHDKLKERLSAAAPQAQPAPDGWVMVPRHIFSALIDEAYSLETSIQNIDKVLEAKALLVTTRSAPAVAEPLTDEQTKKLRDALAQTLGDTYVCTRVWEAWHVGTMSQDDFEPADQCQELLDGLIDAVRAHGIGTKGSAQLGLDTAGHHDQAAI